MLIGSNGMMPNILCLMSQNLRDVSSLQNGKLRRYDFILFQLFSNSKFGELIFFMLKYVCSSLYC